MNTGISKGVTAGVALFALCRLVQLRLKTRSSAAERGRDKGLNEVDDSGLYGAVLLEEYRAIDSGISRRIDLQHRNMNVFLVLAVGIVGLIVTIGTKSGSRSFAITNGALLVPALAVLANVFLWRHINHDAGIIESADYIASTIRPAVVQCTGRDALGYEEYLRNRRTMRWRHLYWVVDIGQESVPLFVILALSLVAGWLIQSSVTLGSRAISNAYLVFLIIGTVLSPLSILLMVLISSRYRTIGVLIEGGQKS